MSEGGQIGGSYTKDEFYKINNGYIENNHCSNDKFDSLQLVADIVCVSRSSLAKANRLFINLVKCQLNLKKGIDTSNFLCWFYHYLEKYPKLNVLESPLRKKLTKLGKEVLMEERLLLVHATE